MKTISMLTFLALAAVASVPATAATLVYTASLSGANESPANDSMGTGTARVTIDTVLNTMRVEAEFSGLTGTTTASHIHCCTVDPFLLNAGVATQTPSFTGFPLGVTAGVFDQTLDMTQASSYNSAFITAHGGTVQTALDDLLAGLDSGRAYLNIHSTYRTGGEIRGFLTAVPVPAALPLLASALAGLGVAARRRAA
jgi:hypothetical protein